MKNKIRQILRERWDWDSLEDAVPVPYEEVKRYVIHSTNVDPRIIYNNGIDPVCASESKTWKDLKYPCVVFAVNAYHTIWSLGETKGAVVIDTSLIPDNEWWYDPSLYNERDRNGKISIVTDKRIPADAVIGILCLDDLKEMVRRFKNNTSDEEAQQYLDDVIRVNNEEWSNDCVAKSDSTSDNKEGKDKKVKTNYINKTKSLIQKILKEETSGFDPKMLNLLYKFMNTLTKDYVWYYDNPEQSFRDLTETIWLINPKTQEWVVQLEKGRLWWYYEFYENFQRYFNMEYLDYEKFIKIWVEDVLNREISKTGIKDLGLQNILTPFKPSTHALTFTSFGQLEDIINYGKQIK